MGEVIKICAGIGLFTIYLIVTSVPGFITYRFLKHTTIDNPIDSEAIAKGLLVSYAVGLVACVWGAIYFILVRG